MSTGYSQRRKSSRRTLKEQAAQLQYHASMVTRLVGALFLELGRETVTLPLATLESAKAVNLRVNTLADGGVEISRLDAE